MFKKNAQSSVWDSLIRIMPSLAPQISKRTDSVDPMAANILYSVWRTGSSSDGNTFKKPVTMAKDEVDRLKQAGLVQVIGDNLSVTKKGSKVLKIMILGDERSIYEDNGVQIDYNTAVSNMHPTKCASKIASSEEKKEGWWDRFEE